MDPGEFPKTRRTKLNSEISPLILDNSAPLNQPTFSGEAWALRRVFHATAEYTKEGMVWIDTYWPLHRTLRAWLQNLSLHPKLLPAIEPVPLPQLSAS